MKTLHTILIGAGLAFPYVIIFWPVLFGGHVFADGDAVLQMYPAAYTLQQVLQNGESFVWNPHILTGFPMAASFVGGFFSPLYHVIFRYFDIFTAYHVLSALNFIIAAWLTYLVCRLLKLSTASSLFAGITFPLGTAYWLFGSNLTVTSGVLLIPGLLVATLLINRSKALFPRIAVTLASGTILGLLLLQAHPQWPVMAMMESFLFALFVDYSSHSSNFDSLQILQSSKFKVQSSKQIQNSNLKRSFIWILGLICHLSFVIWIFFKTLITSLRSTYWTLLVFIIGLLISLPQLLASIRIGEFSARGEGIDLSSAASGSLLPADLFSFLLPNLSLPFIMQKPFLLYTGAIPFLLAIISFALPKPKHYRFFFWTFVVCLLIAVKYSPLFLIIHQLPILDAFREPSRFMYIGLFAFTMMAAFGLEQLIEIKNKLPSRVAALNKWLTRSVITLTSLVALSSIAIAIWRTQFLNVLTSYFDTHIYSSTTKLPLEHYHNVIKALFDQTVAGITPADPRTAVGIVSLLLGSFLISWYVRRQKTLSSPTLIEDPERKNKQKQIVIANERERSAAISFSTQYKIASSKTPRNDKFFLFSFLLSGFRVWARNDNLRIFFSAGIIAITFLNGIGVKIGTLHTAPQSLITTPPASAEILQQLAQEPYRAFSFLSGASIYQELDSNYGYDPEANIELMKNLLVPNLNIFYGIDSLDYYDDLMDRRNARLLRHLGSNRGTYGESLAETDIPFEEKKALFLERLPLLSMANVRYITSLYPLEHPRLKLFSQFPVSNFQLPVFVYENLDVLPRYYLTNEVEISSVLSEEESWQNLLRQKTVNKKQSTLVECASCESRLLTNFAMAENVRQSNIQILPVHQTNTEYTFNIKSSSGQWFFFGQNNLPGWSASVDGQHTEIFRANFLFQAIRVPAGKHMVEWEYQL